MFIISIIYLIGAIVLICLKKFDWVNLFNTDGLALFGCISALGELILSKRNCISRKINELYIGNRYTNFRIDINTKYLINEVQIEQISNKFETIINSNLELKDLERKPINRLINDRWVLKYESIGLEVEYQRKRSNFIIILKGKTQYGKIKNRKKDILYLNLLIKLLSNKFLSDKDIRKVIEVSKIDLIIYLNGSQFKLRNIFNEDLLQVKSYNIKITKDLDKTSEVIINNDQVKLSVLREGDLITGFDELTNIICNIN